MKEEHAKDNSGKGQEEEEWKRTKKREMKEIMRLKIKEIAKKGEIILGSLPVRGNIKK